VPGRQLRGRIGLSFVSPSKPTIDVRGLAGPQDETDGEVYAVLLLIPQFCPHRTGTGLLVHSNILLARPSKAPPRSKLSCSGVISVHKLIPSSHHSLGRLYQALSDDENGPAWMSEQRLALCRPVSPDNHLFLHCNLRSSRICSPACLQSSETARFLLFFLFFLFLPSASMHGTIYSDACLERAEVLSLCKRLARR